MPKDWKLKLILFVWILFKIEIENTNKVLNNRFYEKKKKIQINDSLAKSRINDKFNFKIIVIWFFLIKLKGEN